MLNTVLECGIIPKGTKVKIDGCPFVLHDDVKVAADQEIVDLAIKNQNDFYNGVGVGVGVGVVSWGAGDCLRELKTGNCQVHGEFDSINGNPECKASKPR